MRKPLSTIILLLGLFLPTSTQAQHAYRPLVVEGKNWVSVYVREKTIFTMEDGVIVGTEKNTETGEMHEVLQGDTVINGLSYLKLNTGTPYKSYCHVALREENRRVYAYSFAEQKELLLYDFSMEQGDVVTAGINGGRSKECHVVEKRDIQLQGESYALFAVDVCDGHDSYRSYWVEGIGSFIGILFEESGVGATHSNRDEITDAEHYTGPFISWYDNYLFDYCKLGDDLLGTREEIWSYTTGIRSVEVNNPSASDIYYDLSGRRIQNAPMKGVYIQDGRKVMVK